MTEAGSVYGQALYDLAMSEGLSGKILEELEALRQSFESEPDYIRLLSTPNLPKEERCQILDKGFRGKIQPYLLNFMKILTEKGYMRHFSDCCAAYRDCYNRDNGILPVRVVTAVALSAKQQKRLSEKLAAITGKRIDLNLRIDPQVLGGIRLDYDGKRLDDTVAHRLDAIRNVLNNTVL
ncbi:MAG: ATP synthase F1 subunit delta [Oscillospiraceae bacterium]|nr:ATP synthase F1 subunit delta [Oscillospiraceae bacterium]